MPGFQYKPSDASECLPAGDYDAQLDVVEETVSKKGNPMLVVDWLILLNGRKWSVRDYIVSPQAIWKLKQIAVAFNQLDDFNDGVFDASMLLGQVATLSLIVRTSPEFGDQNSVKAYRAVGGNHQAPASVPTSAPADEDVPF